MSILKRAAFCPKDDFAAQPIWYVSMI